MTRGDLARRRSEALGQAIARRQRVHLADRHRSWQRAQALGFRGMIGQLQQARRRWVTAVSRG